MTVWIGGELVLHGGVGDRYEDGFTSQDVMLALAGVDPQRPVKVRINSGGGDAFDGIAIYNALANHPGEIHIIVDGLAASAASVIAMAGDTITMRQGAMMMIHCAHMLDSSEPAWLEHVNAQMAGIYAKRTGHSTNDIHALMAAETWMDGPEAVASRFATACDEAPAAVWAQLVGNYQNAPASVREHHARRGEAILRHPEADGRGALAQHLADTRVPLVVAVGILRSSPRTSATAWTDREISDGWRTAIEESFGLQPSAKQLDANNGWALAVADTNRAIGLAVTPAAAQADRPDPHGWRKIVADLNRANGF